MSSEKELLRAEPDGTISFGDHTLSEKKKVDHFELNGNELKVKSFYEITRLESNELFVYESVPGTTVHYFRSTADGVSFDVEGDKDASITLGMEENTSYRVTIGNLPATVIGTHVGGKLNLSVELSEGNPVHIEITRE